MISDEPLAVEQVTAFRRDGLVLVRNLFSPQEIQAIAAITEELAGYPEEPGKVMMYFEDSLNQPGKRLLSRIENFYPYHRGFEALVEGPQMQGAASQLFGEPAVLFKDKINFKLPGGSGFTPHQDIQAGWDVYAGNFITVMVTIDPTTPENGCLEWVAGRHDRGLLGEMWHPLAETTIRDLEFLACPTRPGDVAFFDAYTPHRSGPNRTDRSRRVLYITYNRRSEGDHRVRYYQDKRKSYPPDCEREPDKRYVFRV